MLDFFVKRVTTNQPKDNENTVSTFTLPHRNCPISFREKVITVLRYFKLKVIK